MTSPPINPDPLLNVIFNYYSGLFSRPDVSNLVQSLLGAAQTDAINYAAAQPSVILGELPGLLSMFNPIFAAQTDFYPQLLASETSIAAQITSIAAADQADPNKMVGGLMADPTFTSFLTSLVTILPTAAASYLAASPSLILIDQLPALLTAANTVFTTEPFYPSLLALETQVQAAMTSIVRNYDASKWATVTGTATIATQVLTTTLAAGVLGSASAKGNGSTSGMDSKSTMSIAPFKGAAAPTGGVKAMAAVGGVVLGFAAML